MFKFGAEEKQTGFCEAIILVFFICFIYMFQVQQGEQVVTEAVIENTVLKTDSHSEAKIQSEAQDNENEANIHTEAKGDTHEANCQTETEKDEITLRAEDSDSS